LKLPTFVNWTIIGNPNNQPTKDYCLRCGTNIEWQGHKPLAEHTRFCRLRKIFTSKEHFIAIPEDKLEDNGSESLTIKRKK